MENHFNTLQKSTTVGNIVFLLLAFPLGLFYFLVTVIGFSLGLGMLVIWIGLPILFATLFIIRGGMAEIERRMVSSLLRLPIPYQMPGQNEPRLGFLRRFGKILTDPYTWTSMIYMLLKLPIGIISFTLTLTFSILSASLTLMPLAYLINLFVNMILLKNGISNSSIMIPYFIEIHGSFDPVMFARSFVGVPVGLVVWFVTRFLLNGLALVSGELTRALLGPGMAYTIAQPHSSYTSPMPREEQPIYQEQRIYRE